MKVIIASLGMFCGKRIKNATQGLIAVESISQISHMALRALVAALGLGLGVGVGAAGSDGWVRLSNLLKVLTAR